MKRRQLFLSCCAGTLLAACSGGGGSNGGGGFAQPATHPLNDTGITLCGDYADPDATHNNDVDCDQVGATQTVGGTEIANGLDPVPAGQDAVYGRDVDDDSNTDGSQGFIFTKLSFYGDPLPYQDRAWNPFGGESDSTQWSCVRDEVTGLVWEVKTDKSLPDLRDKDWTYTWYDSNNLTNGGNAGTPDTGTPAASDNCYFKNRCDTERYVENVNFTGLCGATDWRLPTAEELKTLRHLGMAGGKSIDTHYFPDTLPSYYWTSTSRAIDSGYAWVIAFNNGENLVGAKSSSYAVRLVRDAN